MGSISVEQFLERPDKLLSNAQGGEIAVVTQDGEPVFMAVPMGVASIARAFDWNLRCPCLTASR